ncbi:MAG: polyphenol oxidase family protein [Succinivibrio sp.]
MAPFEAVPQLSPCLAGFTGRAGGISPPPYGTLNLGSNTGDLPENVARNRRILERAAGRRIVYMRQVHGARVLEADAMTEDGLECDALVTCDPSIAVAVLTADCLPLLLSCDGGRACAAVHCGWRGAVAGIAGKAVLKLLDLAGSSASVKAFIGPCIRQQSFEVGPEVREAALCGLGRSGGVMACFSKGRGDRLMCSLPGLVRLSLEQAGVDPSCIFDCLIDTYADASSRYSWRRGSDTGREASFIGPASR